jgi:hypothetical protein
LFFCDKNKGLSHPTLTIYTIFFIQISNVEEAKSRPLTLTALKVEEEKYLLSSLQT